jgi:serine phosphatase RsbU (regulator of sigma subunit)
MSTTRTFKVSGTATLLGVACIALAAGAKAGDAFGVLGGLLLMFAAPPFAVSLVRHLLRGILWRVGSRLFVSYLLIGVVPLPFLLALSYLGIVMVTGQIAARRLDDHVRRRADALAVLVRRATEGPANAIEPRLAEGVKRLGEGDPGFPGLGYAVWRGAAPPSGSGSADLVSFLLPKDASIETGPFLARTKDDVLLAALARKDDATVLAYFPLRSGDAKRALARENGTVVYLSLSFPHEVAAKGASDVEIRANGKGITIEERGEKRPRPRTHNDTETVLPKAGSGPVRGRWVSWGIRLDLPSYDATDGKLLAKSPVTFFIQTSLAAEFDRLFGAPSEKTNRIGAGKLFLGILAAFGVFTLLVYAVASLVAGLLVFRIARATSRLSRGFAEVEAGNFGHRAVLKGNDQLAGLVASFNRMTENLKASVEERAEREALAHELALARDIQRRLLPPQDFTFPGLEIAADFRPAAAIGGDFYHLLPEDDHTLAVVVADVSGHGLSTGIVMASAKASLSALASTTGSAEKLFERLDQEIRDATDARTFVTLGHARFRLRERRLELTNAGQLYPYRVTAKGDVSSVENPSRPLGLSRPTTFRTVSSALEEGDLWVFLSDGIIEARDAGGEPFGFTRLEEVLRAHTATTAESLKNAILAAWRAHRGGDEPEDDRTLVVVRVEPKATSTGTSR